MQKIRSPLCFLLLRLLKAYGRLLKISISVNECQVGIKPVVEGVLFLVYLNRLKQTAQVVIQRSAGDSRHSASTSINIPHLIQFLFSIPEKLFRFKVIICSHVHITKL